MSCAINTCMVVAGGPAGRPHTTSGTRQEVEDVRAAFRPAAVASVSQRGDHHETSGHTLCRSHPSRDLPARRGSPGSILPVLLQAWWCGSFGSPQIGEASCNEMAKDGPRHHWAGQTPAPEGTGQRRKRLHAARKAAARKPRSFRQPRNTLSRASVPTQIGSTTFAKPASDYRLIFSETLAPSPPGLKPHQGTPSTTLPLNGHAA